MYNIERALVLLKEKHICPHCQTRLSLCEEPDQSFADGLGWGGFLFMCLSDDCGGLLTSKEFKDKFSSKALTRYTFLPGEIKGFYTPVYSLDAFKQQVITGKDLIGGELNRLRNIVEDKLAAAVEANMKHRESRAKLLEFIKENCQGESE